MMRNKRKWDESQSGQWKYFLENEKKKNQDFKRGMFPNNLR